MYVFKAINGTAPQYICDMVEVREPPRALRQRSLLVVPRTRTVTYGRRIFKSAAANLWNSLPEDLKKMNSIINFKKHLKTFLFKKAFSDSL